MQFRDETTKLLTKKYDRLGKKIETCFPLLDPTFDINTAVAKHQMLQEPENVFMTQKPNLEIYDDEI